ncbi:hypothetical protein [Actinacidiphila bryophytorum]|uniref:Uncharacterized protein n=1 Tax=Actinacidiphila bryophytorum TaxID=1436133 RepID=A0A9W4H5L0_9ACTN|nr:hypothetical protein [Actinacidiphila bryophytorum]MBM9437425.1 hypothetical protein [Actinacidiphila bryophytorum]CAG7652072.1 conserved hypothetical protein [Actinacidiphila bryophytorum]
MSAVTEAEDELRVLLERAVPQLPAPAQRLERVRERMRRRRRRRTAAVGVSAVLAVAAVVAVPGLVRPHGGAAPAVVATGGPAPVRTTPVRGPEPTPTPRDGYRPDGMQGLVITPPAGWQLLEDPDTGSVFLSTQALVLPPNGCAHALDGFCTPLARVLKDGGSLVMFHLTYSKVQAQKLGDVAMPLEDEDVLRSCRTVNGTRQMGRTIVDQAPGSGNAVWAVACMAQPSTAQKEQVRLLVANADFG